MNGSKRKSKTAFIPGEMIWIVEPSSNEQNMNSLSITNVELNNLTAHQEAQTQKRPIRAHARDLSSIQ